MSPLLDRTRKYVVLGRDERIWIFAWEHQHYNEDEPYCWQCYYVKPGGLIVATGPKEEREVFDFLEQNSHKLDSDDKLDLALFLHKGGLESFLKKEQEKNDSTG